MSDLKIFQKGWNFRQDGPGNRLVYHLQGCNLRCPWCSNPEGMIADGSLIERNDRLIPEICPHGAISGQSLDRSICGQCTGRECVTVNFNQGVRLSCRSYPLPALIGEVRESMHLFHDGGGVTLSGGEPTMQFPEVREFLELLQSENVNTAIETNGSHPHLAGLFPLIDTLIFDLKHHDDAIASPVIGAGTAVALENLRKAAELHPCVWLRITLIPGFNDSPDDIRRLAGLVGALPAGNLSLELLAYHEYGKVKWEQCGKRYQERAAPVGQEQLAQYENIFSRNGVKVVRT